MKKILVSVAAGVLLLLVLAGLAFAARRGSAPVAQPFTGSLQAKETNVQHPELGTFTVTGKGSGTADRLGEFTLSYQIDVNTTTRASSNGTERFVAANGDTIYAEGHGQGARTAKPGLTAPTEWYTVKGGTGRFAGATGSYVIHRTLNLGSSTTWGTFEGTITIP